MLTEKMMIIIVCILSLMILALLVACSVFWWAFDISNSATKNLNRIKSGYQWTSQDMVENHCRRKAADLILRFSIIFWTLLVAAGMAYYFFFVS